MNQEALLFKTWAPPCPAGILVAQPSAVVVNELEAIANDLLRDAAWVGYASAEFQHYRMAVRRTHLQAQDMLGSLSAQFELSVQCNGLTFRTRSPLLQAAQLAELTFDRRLY